MSLSIPEIDNIEVMLNIGYNAASAHPLVARHMLKAKQKGAKIICVDPRFTETARISDIFLQIKGGTNMAVINGIANVIIAEDLIDHEFVEAHTTGFDEYKAVLLKYTPEYA
ncbi:molybdopterin-dependent oxidoreductase, partial [Treponema endosymbiont of Eucomonympha sp.]